MDSEGKGMIDFNTFCDWWSNLKVNDALGLRQQWKRRLYEDESKQVGGTQIREEKRHFSIGKVHFSKSFSCKTAA